MPNFVLKNRSGRYGVFSDSGAVKWNGSWDTSNVFPTRSAAQSAYDKAVIFTLRSTLKIKDELAQAEYLNLLDEHRSTLPKWLNQKPFFEPKAQDEDFINSFNIIFVRNENSWLCVDDSYNSEGYCWSHNFNLAASFLTEEMALKAISKTYQGQGDFVFIQASCLMSSVFGVKPLPDFEYKRIDISSNDHLSNMINSHVENRAIEDSLKSIACAPAPIKSVTRIKL